MQRAWPRSRSAVSTAPPSLGQAMPSSAGRPYRKVAWMLRPSATSLSMQTLHTSDSRRTPAGRQQGF